MNLLIIEDEEKLANQLKKLLYVIDPEIKVVSVIGSVKSAIAIIPSLDSIDLMLVDIYLSDGLSFEIFQSIEVHTPIVFCTAYDQYALKAFEVDSVDYLLKPIKQSDLTRAIAKYKRLYASDDAFPFLKEKITSLVDKLGRKRVVQRNLLLPFGDRLVPVSVDDIAYFHSEYGTVKAITSNNKMYPMDESLDALNESLDSNNFYRANRQFIINRKSIIDIESYFNGRLYVNIEPKPKKSIIISKSKASEFKSWMAKS